MFDEYLKLLSSTISDDLGLSIVRKELEDSVFFEKFFNEEHGKDYYTGTCLTAPVARQNKSMLIKTSLYNPIKIRIQGLHDFSLPNPCSSTTADPLNVISRHPIAFGSRPTGEGERIPVFGEIIKCYFEKGPDDFGKMRGIRYEYPIENSRTDFRCMNSLLKNKKLQSLNFLKQLNSATSTYTSAVIVSIANKYDNDSRIPRKAHLDWHIARLHPQFRPYLKSFIYECWHKLEVQIIMGNAGGGYRSPTKAASMRTTWDNWVSSKPTGVPTTSEVYKKWKAKKPYVAKPALYSHHNTGTGIDFNPKLKSGHVIHSSEANTTWTKSGVISIAKSLGLRWGGDFGKPDRVHLDMEKWLPPSKRIQMIKEAKTKGISPIDISF